MYRLVVLKSPAHLFGNVEKVYNCVSSIETCENLGYMYTTTTMLVRPAHGDGSYFDNLVDMSGILHDDSGYETVFDASEGAFDVEDPNNYHKWIANQTDWFDTLEELIASPQMGIIQQSVETYKWLLKTVGYMDFKLDPSLACQFAYTISDRVSSDITTNVTPLIDCFVHDAQLCYNFIEFSYNLDEHIIRRLEKTIATDGEVAYNYCIFNKQSIPIVSNAVEKDTSSMHDAILTYYTEDSNEYRVYKILQANRLNRGSKCIA